MPRRLAFGKAKPGMVFDVVPDAAWFELIARRREIALCMATEEAPGPVEQARHDEQPGEGKMPVARGREIIARGNRDKRWEGNRIAARYTKHAGGRNLHRANTEIACVAVVPDLQPGMLVIGAIFAPVQFGVGIEDHQPAHQHHEDGDGVDPMPDPREPALAINQGTANRRGLRLEISTQGCIPLVRRWRSSAPRGPISPFRATETA